MKILNLSVDTIFFVISGINLISIFLSFYQYIYQKSKIYLYSFLYWLCILVNAVIHLSINNQESYFYFLALTGSFASQLILSFVVSEIKQNNLIIKNELFIFGIITGISIIFKILGFYQVYLYIAILGIVIPVLKAVLKRKNTSSPTTNSQKLFYLSAILLSLHYLDYPFFKKRPELFVVACVIALMLMFILATVMPMVVNELELFRRNINLENEIQKRIQEIRMKDMQVWESEKYASIGRISGLIAHEVNSPLTAISVAATNIIRQIKNPHEESIILENSKLIKQVISNISAITEKLKKASGDQLGRNKTRLSINKKLSQINYTLKELSLIKHMDISIEVEGADFEVTANSVELEHAIRMTLLFLLSDNVTDVDVTKTSKIKIELQYESRSIIFSIINEYNNELNSISSGSEFNFSLEQNSDFNLVVIKSLLQANNIDFLVHNKENSIEVIFKFGNP